MADQNVFGEPLIPCSHDPLTGFYRDGRCNSGEEDFGVHTVCVVLTEEFLRFSKEMGNDLSTPRIEYEFPGLKPGEHWCLCANRWKEAYDNGVPPLVVLEATNEKTLEIVEMNQLLEFAFRANA